MLLDASVIYSGITAPMGASAAVLAALTSGELAACTTDNAIEEVARRLLAEFSRSTLKLQPERVRKELRRLRALPNFVVHPWANPPVGVLPGNRKDAYLVHAAEIYRPDFLVTRDKALLRRGRIGETRVVEPHELLG